MNPSARPRLWTLAVSILLHAAVIGFLATLRFPQPIPPHYRPVALLASRYVDVAPGTAPPSPHQSSIHRLPRAFHVPDPLPQPAAATPAILDAEPALVLSTDIPQLQPPPLVKELPPVRTVKPAGFSAVESNVDMLTRRRPAEVGGFDAAAAVPDKLPAGKIASGSFGDASVAVDASRVKKSTHAASFLPAEIISKPRPVYTQEARTLRIEGEVLLEVLFGASGQARVLRTIRGLGHGLDENATAAARAIQFRPATRGDEVVDSTAVVRIVFQLAY